MSGRRNVNFFPARAPFSFRSGTEGGTARLRAGRVRDEGGPWHEHPGADRRPHSLAIVRALAVGSGTDGDALTGWIAWARIDWPGPQPGLLH
jgi:hypothetical protein